MEGITEYQFNIFIRLLLDRFSRCKTENEIQTAVKEIKDILFSDDSED